MLEDLEYLSKRDRRVYVRENGGIFFLEERCDDFFYCDM